MSSPWGGAAAPTAPPLRTPLAGTLPVRNRYSFFINADQDPCQDVKFILRNYRDIRRSPALCRVCALGRR